MANELRGSFSASILALVFSWAALSPKSILFLYLLNAWDESWGLVSATFLRFEVCSTSSSMIVWNSALLGAFWSLRCFWRSSDIASFAVASSFGGRPLPESLNVEIPLKVSAWCCRIIRSIDVSGIEWFLAKVLESNPLAMHSWHTSTLPPAEWKAFERSLNLAIRRWTSSACITTGVCKSQYSFCTLRILQEIRDSIVRSVLTITYPKHDANYCSPSENVSVQRVKACMKVIGFGHWIHNILLHTTFRSPLVYPL